MTKLSFAPWQATANAMLRASNAGWRNDDTFFKVLFIRDNED